MKAQLEPDPEPEVMTMPSCYGFDWLRFQERAVIYKLVAQMGSDKGAEVVSFFDESECEGRA